MNALLHRSEAEHEHATKLIFPETPQPHAQVWEGLDEETRRAVLERLAELMASATTTDA